MCKLSTIGCHPRICLFLINYWWYNITTENYTLIFLNSSIIIWPMKVLDYIFLTSFISSDVNGYVSGVCLFDGGIEYIGWQKAVGVAVCGRIQDSRLAELVCYI